MDPALQELIREELNPNDEIEAIIRLVQKNKYPPDVKPIAQFGHVITGRVLRKNIRTVYEHTTVASFKAPRTFYSDTVEVWQNEILVEKENIAPTGLTGKGIVIGIIDWGCDFAHHDFINPDGSTRIIALWDQGHKKNTHSPHPYEYGKLFTRDAINKALKTNRPYEALSYHPGKTDKAGTGMHGTHVMGIAAANGKSGTKGVAPDAEIIFVHLAANDSSGEYNLGDSVRILEAIDFVRKTAADKPVAINLSIGKHGGPHDGRTLVEIAIDEFLEENNNTAICQSTGNYFSSETHSSAMVRPGDKTILQFKTDVNDITPNEIEIWYPGRDEFEITLWNENHPANIFVCNIDKTTDIIFNNQLVGRMYHRSDDPNNNKNHADIFLYTNTTSGIWNIELQGKKITDGRFDAWIERDGGCKYCQSKFIGKSIVATRTTNTICNGFNTIVTGAYDNKSVPISIAPFSSSGPTTDGRIKPAVLAPGVKIVSSKSSPPSQLQGGAATVAMSGTSMASPYITGIAALVLQDAGKPLTVHELRKKIFSSCSAVDFGAENIYRSGYGVFSREKFLKNLGLSAAAGMKSKTGISDESNPENYKNKQGCSCGCNH